MKRHTVLFLILLSTCCSNALPMGRHPTEENDTFPDYNKLDMHPKSKNAPAPPPPVSNPPPASVTAPPPLNSPMNLPPSDEDIPKAPPKVVPVPDDSSEPPMPDSIKDTLEPTATGQR
jgi:hypothetical protein